MIWVLLLGLVSAACGDSAIPLLRPGGLRVVLDVSQTGTPEKPLEFSATTYRSFTIDVEALRSDRPNELDSTFNGWVVVEVHPTGETERTLHAIELTDGRASRQQVGIRQAYGEVRIVVSDVGFRPAADPRNARCNNGKDDDGDGYIDTQDNGCYSMVAGDDTETGGSGATGASPPLYFTKPRINDIQRPAEDKDETSPLDGHRVTVDRGWLLVTQVGTNGMYITDYEGATWDASANKWQLRAQDLAYDSIFVFNYSQPLNLQAGDCLVSIDGGVMEFYGYTELQFPVWKKGDFGFCGVRARKAGVAECPDKESDGACTGDAQCKEGYLCQAGTCRPDPSTDRHELCRQRIEGLISAPVDITTLTLDHQGEKVSVWDPNFKLAEAFEGGIVQVSNVSIFTEAHKCDFNGNQLIDFYAEDQREDDCYNDCGENASCSQWYSYNRFGQWTVHFKDSTGVTRELAVLTTGAVPNFDPMKDCSFAADYWNCKRKPQRLGKLVGTLRNLSFARPPWILEARSAADCPDCKNPD
jgi:hypothetical protein